MKKDMKQITIEQLGEKIIARLLCISNLKSVYIGKTENIRSTEVRHTPEYDGTIPLAVGEPELISKGEDYLIRLLKEKLPASIIIDNQKEGSAGNPNANMLYASLNINYETIDELNDDDLFDELFELIYS